MTEEEAYDKGRLAERAAVQLWAANEFALVQENPAQAQVARAVLYRAMKGDWGVSVAGRPQSVSDVWRDVSKQVAEEA